MEMRQWLQTETIIRLVIISQDMTKIAINCNALYRNNYALQSIPYVHNGLPYVTLGTLTRDRYPASKSRDFVAGVTSHRAAVLRT